MPENRFSNESNNETSTDKRAANEKRESRRRFMRNVAVGAAGATIAMSRADRILARQTQSHVNQFFGLASSYSLSPATKQAFLNVTKTVLGVVKEGGSAKSSYDAISSYMGSSFVDMPPGQPVTELGLTREESNTIATLYLGAMSALSSRSLSENDIRQGLSNPKAIFDKFESDFVGKLNDKTKAEATNSLSLSKKLADATAQLRAAADELAGMGITGQTASRSGIMKPVSFSPLQQPACSINGTPIQHWQVCVVIVVVVIVAILAK